MADYYEDNAARYFEATRETDMGPLRFRFLAHLPAGGRILDAGCGSGRDSRAFLADGYAVVAFDGSAALAELAGPYIGRPVEVRTFSEVDWHEAFDGVWACASLLHLPWAELPDAVARLARALKPGGVLYMSFKHGRGERTEGERFFLDLDEAGLDALVAAVPELVLIEAWRSADRRGEAGRQDWLNALARKA
jgi:SAM-dependent methyltransferase